MNPSETVQAAQRLLAEREAVGLRKYGTTVDRTDLSPAQWAQHLLEELSDAVLYLIRLKAEIAELEDNAREMAAGQCVHPLGIMGGAHGHALCRLNGKGHGSLEYWGVDQSEVVKDLPVLKQVLDRLPKLFEATGAKSLDELIEHLRAERQATPVTDFNLYTSPDVWTSQPAPAAAPEGAERRFGPVTSDPADAERNIRAKEDAERAAYLERWRNAPEDATHLAQDSDGVCAFYGGEPALDSDQNWFGSIVGNVENNLLGSVRCEPRPVQGVGP